MITFKWKSLDEVLDEPQCNGEVETREENGKKSKKEKKIKDMYEKGITKNHDGGKKSPPWGQLSPFWLKGWG